MIYTRKNKKGQWEACDEYGNVAVGYTKEAAEKNYHSLYDNNDNYIGLDFSKINIGGFDND